MLLELVISTILMSPGEVKSSIKSSFIETLDSAESSINREFAKSELVRDQYSFRFSITIIPAYLHRFIKQDAKLKGWDLKISPVVDEATSEATDYDFVFTRTVEWI